jgi:hypothetical protein
MKANEINIRDPFILSDNGAYYLYGSRVSEAWGECTGLDVYVSRDLMEWSDPAPAFERFDGFWANLQYWAPEVHLYKGEYYMLATFRSKTRERGTQILKASSPKGPFLPHSDGPVTPETWSCLDGTLYVENGVPYMVFCHEWSQIVDGSICSVRLSDDLSRAVEEPRVLFRASEAAITSDRINHGFITDGPFLYKTKSGALVMIWSSFDEKGYIEVISASESGSINGEWRHLTTPLFDLDGGHGMLFRDGSGELCFTFHSPNAPRYAERVEIRRVRELASEPYLELI